MTGDRNKSIGGWLMRKRDFSLQRKQKRLSFSNDDERSETTVFNATHLHNQSNAKTQRLNDKGSHETTGDEESQKLSNAKRRRHLRQ
mmetsp:Transcript_17399/g.33017  ORF Transcript_17399/g.33017 Transcript_17399/m.33017 type:complete len:87 (+) Transcript_17399:179-439(+)